MNNKTEEIHREMNNVMGTNYNFARIGVICIKGYLIGNEKNQNSVPITINQCISPILKIILNI